MTTKQILALILVALVAIGAFMWHEETESPVEKAGETVGQLADDVEDATR